MGRLEGNITKNLYHSPCSINTPHILCHSRALSLSHTHTRARAHIHAVTLSTASGSSFISFTFWDCEERRWESHVEGDASMCRPAYQNLALVGDEVGQQTGELVRLRQHNSAVRHENRSSLLHPGGMHPLHPGLAITHVHRDIRCELVRHRLQYLLRFLQQELNLRHVGRDGVVCKQTQEKMPTRDQR